MNELSARETHDRGVFAVNTGVNFALALIALSKGKPRTALIGGVVPFVALIGAVRLARPVSPWAKRFYRHRHRARARAIRRAYRHDRRWAGPRRRLEEFIGGAPDQDLAAIPGRDEGPPPDAGPARPPPRTAPAPPGSPPDAPCPPGCP